MTFHELGIIVPFHSTGNVKTHCPRCRDQRRHNKGDKSLSVNVQEGIWNCHHCGYSGSLKEMRDFTAKPKKEYVKPMEAQLTLSERAQNYLFKRGFSTYTIQRFKIVEGPEFIPRTGKPENCLQFKYYRNDELINIKYRDGAKNFKLVKDAELIFYNLDSIQGETTCVITEGEFDCMAAFEAGYRKGIVSVPNGASKGNQRLEYVDNCYDQFEGIKEVIIATDTDEPGMNLRMELARRFGKHRCKYVTYPEGCKDFNEVLLRHVKDKSNPLLSEIEEGKKDILSIIADAHAFPIDGVFTVEDIEEELDYLYDNGFKPGDRIGYSDFDKLFSFRRGELTIITGIPGSGKSAFVDQIQVRLSARQGWRHGICSFENQPTSLHISKLASCFVGRPFYRADPNSKMNRTEWNWAKYFINENFRFFKISDIDVTIEGILDKCAELVYRFGIDSLLIDPWNCLEHNIPHGMTETQFVSKVLTTITNFAKAHNIHIFLVAHPTKLRKEPVTVKVDGKPQVKKQYEIPTLYSISGSAHFFNKTDNGIVVYRDFETNVITVYIQKVRFFFVGKIGSADFKYEIESGRYAEIDAGSFDNELPHYLQRMGYNLDDLAAIV